MMKKQVFNALIYTLIPVFLSSVLAMIVTKFYGFGFFECLFWIGIVIVAIGGMSSITGNASGSRIVSDNSDSQYQSLANIESLIIERESTNFYANFKKHTVFDPKISGFGVMLAGIILIVVGNHFYQ
ncbi:hypothetical protein REC12_23065 [Desulfosporosinus sp. PR]|uniref:hypothetical protein n=1 Tax=Candidatus Desulfosporosinus nitrosoreducens TaxID=3401928 RepID=UPI0027EFACD7|nr:hypothetical protein [Desulfosporosinus sp. PR]MDQ7096482.1 hypothetical protein [Desulfosporosinus sp. PR]